MLPNVFNSLEMSAKEKKVKPAHFNWDRGIQRSPIQISFTQTGLHKNAFFWRRTQIIVQTYMRLY